MTANYNPYVLLEYPEVADGCTVLIRNPQMVPPELLTVPDATDNTTTMRIIIGRLAVAWRNVYVHDEPGDLDDGEIDLHDLLAKLEAREPKLLGKPSAETAAQLPLVIVNKIAELLSETADPS